MGPVKTHLNAFSVIWYHFLSQLHLEENNSLELLEVIGKTKKNPTNYPKTT